MVPFELWYSYILSATLSHTSVRFSASVLTSVHHNATEICVLWPTQAAGMLEYDISFNLHNIRSVYVRRNYDDLSLCLFSKNTENAMWLDASTSMHVMYNCKIQEFLTLGTFVQSCSHIHSCVNVYSILISIIY